MNLCPVEPQRTLTDTVQPVTRPASTHSHPQSDARIPGNTHAPSPDRRSPSIPRSSTAAQSRANGVIFSLPHIPRTNSKNTSSFDLHSRANLIIVAEPNLLHTIILGWFLSFHLTPKHRRGWGMCTGGSAHELGCTFAGCVTPRYTCE